MSALQTLTKWAATSTFAHVGFAFVAMGGWAVFANRAHPLPEALLAGAVQGAMSGLITLGMKKALERMNVFFLRRRTNLAAIVAPPLITASVILAVLIGAHTLAATPEIAATIAVPFAVSTSYAIIYNLGLVRRGRQHG